MCAMCVALAAGAIVRRSPTRSLRWRSEISARDDGTHVRGRRAHLERVAATRRKRDREQRAALRGAVLVDLEILVRGEIAEHRIVTGATEPYTNGPRVHATRRRVRDVDHSLARTRWVARDVAGALDLHRAGEAGRSRQRRVPALADGNVLDLDLVRRLVKGIASRSDDDGSNCCHGKNIVTMH